MYLLIGSLARKIYILFLRYKLITKVNKSYHSNLPKFSYNIIKGKIYKLIKYIYLTLPHLKPISTRR